MYMIFRNAFTHFLPVRSISFARLSRHFFILSAWSYGQSFDLLLVSNLGGLAFLFLWRTRYRVLDLLLLGFKNFKEFEPFIPSYLSILSRRTVAEGSHIVNGGVSASLELG
ncbi:hypothetical protein ACJX0J_007818 [Zea mays]